MGSNPSAPRIKIGPAEAEPISICGAWGIRTPDLFIANETRYQLRQCPKDSTSLALARVLRTSARLNVRGTTKLGAAAVQERIERGATGESLNFFR